MRIDHYHQVLVGDTFLRAGNIGFDKDDSKFTRYTFVIPPFSCAAVPDLQEQCEDVATHVTMEPYPNIPMCERHFNMFIGV